MRGNSQQYLRPRSVAALVTVSGELCQTRLDMRALSAAILVTVGGHDGLASSGHETYAG